MELQILKYLESHLISMIEKKETDKIFFSFTKLLVYSIIKHISQSSRAPTHIWAMASSNSTKFRVALTSL